MKKVRKQQMPEAQIEQMHERNLEYEWTGRCWNCRKVFTGIRSQLHTCEHCGVNLWSRDG